MNKKMPSIYKGVINRRLGNLQEVYYSKNKVVEEEKKEIKINTREKDNVIDDYEKMTVKEKINYLLNLPKYLPDFTVEIHTKEGIVYTEIESQNQTKLITKSNTEIPIKDIIDIRINN
jgi:hypothetical protein